MSARRRQYPDQPQTEPTQPQPAQPYQNPTGSPYTQPNTSFQNQNAFNNVTQSPNNIMKPLAVYPSYTPNTQPTQPATQQPPIQPPPFQYSPQHPHQDSPPQTFGHGVVPPNPNIVSNAAYPGSHDDAAHRNRRHYPVDEEGLGEGGLIQGVSNLGFQDPSHPVQPQQPYQPQPTFNSPTAPQSLTGHLGVPQYTQPQFGNTQFGNPQQQQQQQQPQQPQFGNVQPNPNQMNNSPQLGNRTDRSGFSNNNAGPGAPVSYAGAVSQAQAIPTSQNQCPSRYVRMTVNTIPATQNLLSKCNIPLGCVITPLAVQENEPIPVVNLGSAGIVRCRRCRSYINPFVLFTEGGRRWKCNVCELPNELPPEYIAPIDPATGLRTDLSSRPELSKGAVEFVAPSEYMVRPPQPPVYFFVIDVTYNAVACGMLYTVIEAIKLSLDKLPGGSRTQIGFITFDRTVHFYSLKSTQSRPQMLVVPDEGVFVPLPDDLLVNLKDSRHLVDDLLDKLPSMFTKTRQVESALGPCLQAAFNVVKHIGGKVMIFQSSLPQVGVGHLSNREDPKLLNTDKEVQLLNPVEPSGGYFKDIALDCTRQQISIDLFLFPAPGIFIDVATLGVLPQITSGQLYYYPGFQGSRGPETERVISDIKHNLTRETGFEGVMRVRCSKGLKVIAHHGNFFIRSADLLALPNVDSDKSFVIQLAITENISSSKYSVIQSALLYTTSSGERRIRVLTVCIPVTTNLIDMFKSADVGSIVNLTAKMAIDKGLGSQLSDAREAMVNKCVEILSVYRESFASTATSSQQLVLPDSLRLLPLYILALIKNTMFRSGSEIRPDERIYQMFRYKILPVDSSIAYLYPDMYSIGSSNEGTQDPNSPFPPTISLSSEKLDRRGFFILDNGFIIFIFIARNTPPSDILQLTGLTVQELVSGPISLKRPTSTEGDALRVYNLVEAIKYRWHQFLPVFIIREGDTQAEALFFSQFIEDRTKNVYSYYEFLCQLQRSVSSKTS